MSFVDTVIVDTLSGTFEFLHVDADRRSKSTLLLQLEHRHAYVDCKNADQCVCVCVPNRSTPLSRTTHKSQPG